MSTEAPAVPVKQGMSDEHKAKLKAGRERAAAERAAKKAASAATATPFPVAPTASPEAAPSADVMAELRRLKEEIAALRTTANAAVEVATKQAASVAATTASIDVEAWYEFKPRGGWKAVEKDGHPRLDTADDPRWDKDLMDPPYNGNVSGCLRVARVTRVNGEVVKTEDIQGGPCHMNEAREFIRTFGQRKGSGEEKPWDTEHFYRDEKKRAEDAKREGRLEDLAVIAEMLRTALSGGPKQVSA